MTQRRPLVTVAGTTKELPVGDTMIGLNTDPTLGGASPSDTDYPSQKGAKTYIDAAIASVIGSGSGSTDGIVSGLGLSYSTTGLAATMSAGSARINGALITATEQTVTLSAADATLPRIDTLYVDDTGTFGKITGTPAANPSQPAVDPTSQLYLAFVLVPATATDLSAGVTTEVIYDEGAEWTPTTSGSGFTANSTNNPNAGTKCIEGTSVAAGAYVKFVDGSPTAYGGDGNLVLGIRSKAAWHAKRSLTLQWYVSGVAVGAPVTLKDGAFGFSSANTTTYQTLSIGKALFSVPSGTIPTELRITAAGSGGSAIGFYIDPIKLQTITAGSGGSGGSGSGITQEQGDARYLLAANNLSDVANPGTSRTKLGLGTGDSPQFTAINLGHASDTTLARTGAGDMAIEGNTVYRAGGTDVPVADGGTGASTASGARTNLDVYSTSQVDAALASAVAGLLDLKGSQDCSANPNFPAASKGDAYIVSVAGKIGGASGTSVDAGDMYFATADNAGGTLASVGSSWTVLEHNLAGVLLAANNLSDVASPTTARNNLGATTVGANIFTMANPSAITFARINADNTVSTLSASSFATAIGLGTGDTPQFTGIEIGHASDTTLARSSAGNLSIEGNVIYRAGGTDVPVADGGTGASSVSSAQTNLGFTTLANQAAYDALSPPDSNTYYFIPV